jgi:uncharacterized protein YkvS
MFVGKFETNGLMGFSRKKNGGWVNVDVTILGDFHHIFRETIGVFHKKIMLFLIFLH